MFIIKLQEEEATPRHLVSRHHAYASLVEREPYTCIPR